MPEATLPSYQAATRKLDWLELADPYIPIDCYARLCCVSWRFRKYFLPKLWADPFAICYALGPISKPDGEEIPRSELFLSTVPYARNGVRSLVLAFTPRIRDWLSMLRYRPQLSSLSLWFPNLRCVTLLDCPPPDDHEHIIQLGACWFPRRPYIVAAARCSQLPVQWPDYEQFRSLIVYFDDSHIHHHQHGRPHPSTLLCLRMPRLRILRATGYDLGDTDAAVIFYHLGPRLWSLDLSTNRLTDRFLKDLVDRFLGRRQVGSRHEDGSCVCLYPGHRYELEGSLCSSGMGLFIHETPWTEDLRLYHPRRYHEDSPEYAENANAEAREVRKRALDDSLEAVIKAIGSQELHSFDYFQPPFLGITHLYLNQNPMLTADGFKLLIEFGFEQLQRFECDSMLFMTDKDMSRYDEYYHDSRAVPSSVSGSKTQAISGILGLSHLFRPVFANLQILRIHHSLVTNLPSLAGFDDLSAMEKIWFAETFLLPRADLVFPNPFHPDMNPRLSSLTLTHIPRYSTGPLIERLKGLLKAAWFQEQTIAKLRTEYRRVQSRYQPPLLPGLRKIFLEFDPDPRDKQGKGQTGTDAYEGFDAEALLNSGATEEFGTFGGFTSRNTRNGTSGPSTSSAVRHGNANNKSATGSRRQQPQDSSELPRLAAETPWVRAVLQFQHQQWSQDVERRADGRLDWNRPVFVASTSPVSGKTKVFVGYNQDDPNQPVLSNNSSVSSSSGLASSSSVVQGPFDSLQSPYHSQEHVQESRMPPSLPLSTQSTPGYSTRRTNSLPPVYPASPTPAPSTSTSTLLPLTPIPPCYTSFPYFLSPEEKQASLTTYDLLISRVLCLHPDGIYKKFSGPGYRPDLPAAGPAGFTAGLNPFSLNILNVLVAYYNSCGNHGAFERDNPELLRLFHPIMAATPSMVRAGVPTQLLKQRLGLGRDERGEREQERWLFEQFSYLRNLGRIRGNEQSNRLERVGQQIMELRERQARRREEAALGVGPEKAELGPGAGAERGTGAGCHVFWNAWKAGLFGDVIFPSVSASASTPSVSASRNEQHSGSSSGLDAAAPSTSTSTSVPSNATERRSAASSRRNRNLLRKDMRRPTKEELSQMKDVIEELKKFRGLTGGGGWSGSSKTESSESKGKGKGKGKGKQKAVDGSENEEDDQDSESEWAGKHWMGELKVIRKTTTDDGGGVF